MCLVVGLTLVYLFTGESSSSTNNEEQKSRRETKADSNDKWKKTDWLADDIPASVAENINNVKIERRTVTVSGVETYVQSAGAPAGVASTGEVVLLLHGAAFSSQTWVDKVDTVRTLAALGHQVVAVDLPGYGRSKARVSDKAEYLRSLITSLTPDSAPVVVSPSMSGSFIIPLLTLAPASVRAWVPVAPVDTAAGREVFRSLSIPTMIVMGERDTGLGSRSRDDLSLIPSSTRAQILPGAGHPAYLDQPQLWHKLLYNFIKAL